MKFDLALPTSAAPIATTYTVKGQTFETKEEAEAFVERSDKIDAISLALKAIYNGTPIGDKPKRRVLSPAPDSYSHHLETFFKAMATRMYEATEGDAEKSAHLLRALAPLLPPQNDEEAA